MSSNSTLSSIRAGFRCDPFLNWVTATDGGFQINSVLAFLFKRLRDQLPHLTFVDKANTDAVRNGIVDMNVEYVLRQTDGVLGVSFPTVYSGTYIYSSKKVNIVGQVVNGVFDWQSYLLLGLSVLTLALLLAVVSGKRLMALEMVVAAFLRQPITNDFERNYRRSTLVLFLATTMLTKMYVSVIRAMLTIHEDHKPIKDLNDVEASGKGIFELIKTFKRLSLEDFEARVKDRIHVFYHEASVEEKMEIYRHVHEGSHVLVDYGVNVESDYSSKLPLAFKCQYPLQNLGRSKDIFSVYGALHWKKGFEYEDILNTVILQATAAGILPSQNVITTMRNRQGKDTYFTTESHAHLDCPSWMELENQEEPTNKNVCPYIPPNNAMTMTQLKDAFIYLLVGEALALVIFIIERLCHHY